MFNVLASLTFIFIIIRLTTFKFNTKTTGFTTKIMGWRKYLKFGSVSQFVVF